jgi:hypothetical protein
MSYIYYKVATLYRVTDYVWQRAVLGSYYILGIQYTVIWRRSGCADFLIVTSRWSLSLEPDAPSVTGASAPVGKFGDFK